MDYKEPQEWTEAETMETVIGQMCPMPSEQAQPERAAVSSALPVASAPELRNPRGSTQRSERPIEVKATHVARKAIGYARQSSLYQVQNYTGSTADQRDQIQHARRWGWPEELIEVVDEDLGQTGVTTQNRAGYLRILDEVKAGKVGALFFSDQSRLARNSVAMGILFQACQMQDTLLVIDGKVSNCQDPNQLLVQQIISNVVEFENHRRRETFERGRIAKARLGNAVSRPPRGYVADRTDGVKNGAWILDPDPAVCESVRAVFRTHLECRSLLRTLRALLKADVQLSRRHSDGRVTWRPPTAPMIQEVLNNPVYTGDYVYRRRRINPAKGRTRTGKWRLRAATPAEMIVLPGHHPAYISREEWDEIQHTFRVNACPRTGQVLGPGCALLQGIIRCAVHSFRMSTLYARPNQNGEVYYAYRCYGMTFKGGKDCISVPGPLLDRAISEIVMQRLQPPALEVLHAEWKRAQQSDRGEESLRRAEIERARNAVEQAKLRCLAVNPKNRHVAEEYERLWEQAQQELQRIELRTRSGEPTTEFAFSEANWKEVLALGNNLSAIWSAPSTDNRDRKEIVRTFLDSVVVEKVGNEVVWATLRRADGTPEDRLLIELAASAYPVITELAAKGVRPSEIARRLNAQGALTSKGRPWSECNVLRRIQIAKQRARRERACA